MKRNIDWTGFMENVETYIRKHRGISGKMLKQLFDNYSENAVKNCAIPLVSKLAKPKSKIKVDDHNATVPYQLCPKCGGDGTVMVQNWNGSNTSISSGLQTCNLCGGAMIIPMHIIPTEYKIQGW